MGSVYELLTVRLFSQNTTLSALRGGEKEGKNVYRADFGPRKEKRPKARIPLNIIRFVRHQWEKEGEKHYPASLS